jgi:uncharacterized protein YjbJ (UPF0337 family)
MAQAKRWLTAHWLLTTSLGHLRSFTGTLPNGPRLVSPELSAGKRPFAADPRTNQKGPAMNWDRIEGNWKQFTGKVKEKWGKLTDDEIAQINGNREQLEGKIQARYGYAKDQVRKDVDDWLNRM